MGELEYCKYCQAEVNLEVGIYRDEDDNVRCRKCNNKILEEGD